MGAVVVIIAILIVNLSKSKTSFGLALVCPLLAWATIRLRNVTRISPAIILLVIPLCYAVFSPAFKIGILERVSWYLYNDYSLTGRTAIWDFVQYEVGQKATARLGIPIFLAGAGTAAP